MATVSSGVPAGRVRSLAASLPRDALAIAGVFAVATWILASYALDVHTFQPDELIYVDQGRGVVRDFPAALWDENLFDLGIARIGPVLTALTAWLFETPTALAVDKVLHSAFYASALIPIALIARGIGLGLGWALAAGVLAIAVPWAPMATSLLTDPVAYGAFAWALYGCWRAAARPGRLGDLIGIVLVGLAPFARSSHAILAGALVVGVVASELRWERPWRSREAAVAALRRHVPLVVVTVLALLYVLTRGTGTLTGVYPVELTPPLGDLFGKSAKFTSFLAQGLAFFPLAIATAWMLRHVVRSLDRTRYALAVTSLVSCLALLFTLNVAVQQERYVMYLAPIMVLLTVAAVVRRDVPVPLAAGALAVAAVVVAVGEGLEIEGAATPGELAGPYSTFIAPGQLWWDRVLEGRLSVALPFGLGHHADVLLYVLLGGGALVAIALVRRAGGLARPAAVALVAVQLALGVAAAGWALEEYVNRAGDPNGPGFEELAWVDKALPEEKWVTGLIAQEAPWNYETVTEILFYNRRYGGAITTTQELEGRLGPGGTLAGELPEHVLVSISLFQSVGIAGDVVEVSPRGTEAIVRPEQPPRATWVASGPDHEGWLDAKDTATVRTWSNCLEMTVGAGPDGEARIAFRDPAGVTVERRLAPQETVRLKTTAPGRSFLRTEGDSTLPPMRYVSARLTDLQAVPC